MFLLILESIGTSELVLIAAVALIIFGPRKLPQMAKTAGKMMSEFRRATSDFKETWEKEVEFEDFREQNETKTIAPPIVARGSLETSAELASPEIREIRAEEIEKHFPSASTNDVATADEATDTKVPAKVPSGKQDWL